MTFATKMRNLKASLNLSTGAMAAAMGVNIGTMNNWLRGINYPNGEMSRRIDTLAGWREGATWDMICEEKFSKSKRDGAERG